MHRHERAGATLRQKRSVFPIREALVLGHLELAVSTAILLEYEEIVTQLLGPAHWGLVERLFGQLFRLHANVLFVEPQFRFEVVTADPDDNKFVDCAIAAQADFIVTEDAHFKVLAGAGYKPQPIAPAEFIAQHLAERR
jgi:putative PIN family toxin of toxin-antitoxin system